MLVVAEEEAFPAVALIAAHHVDTALLTATVALGTLVHICAGEWLVRPWVQARGQDVPWDFSTKVWEQS